MGIADLNVGQRDGLRRIMAHADHDSERVVLSAAIYGVMARPIKARGADIGFALLQRAVNIDHRQCRVGPTGYFNSMSDVVHNAQELLDAANQRALEISKTISRNDLLLGMTGPPSREEIALLEAVDHSGRSQRAVAAHFGIKQQLVNRIKATRLQTIFRDAIKPLQPTISRPAPKGIISGTSEPFGGNPVYVADQPYFRPYVPGQNWRSLSGVK
jgi:hypothetical protein